METVTANSPDDLSARVLADLKTQLERLASYTAEIGVLREGAGSAVHAAGAVVRLVDQLGDLQRDQIAELRAVSDATLGVHRDALAGVADAWGRQWLQEATKSLAVLDTIVARQHALASEITEFQEAMHNAGSFADAQLLMRTQVLELGEAMRQDSAAGASSLEQFMDLVEQKGGALRTALQRTASEQSEAVAGLASAVREGADTSANASILQGARLSELAATLLECDGRQSQEMQQLALQTAELRDAQESLGGQLAELSKAQATHQDYVRNAVHAGQSGSRRWQVATMAVVIVTLLLVELMR